MCAIFGFLNHGNKVSSAVLKKLIKALSICAEVRGIDATGISYVKNGEMITFKRAKPAHKVKLYFPTKTMAVIGHTRFTTQGDEKLNYNNHPFESEKGFTLAHNGVLYNDRELHKKYMLPDTKIETDSYIAVQLLEHFGGADVESIRRMSETVDGSFTFTILRNDNTLFLVKGSNPIAIYHFAELGIYVYASTKEILDNALKVVGFKSKHKEIKLTDGEILQINSDETAVKDVFAMSEKYSGLLHYSCSDDWYDESEKDLLLDYCGMFGVSEDDVELLLDFGYTCDEIEDLLINPTTLEEVLNGIKDI